MTNLDFAERELIKTFHAEIVKMRAKAFEEGRQAGLKEVGADKDSLRKAFEAGRVKGREEAQCAFS